MVARAIGPIPLAQDLSNAGHDVVPDPFKEGVVVTRKPSAWHESGVEGGDRDVFRGEALNLTY